MKSSVPWSFCRKRHKKDLQQFKTIRANWDKSCILEFPGSNLDSPLWILPLLTVAGFTPVRSVSVLSLEKVSCCLQKDLPSLVIMWLLYLHGKAFPLDSKLERKELWLVYKILFQKSIMMPNSKWLFNKYLLNEKCSFSGEVMIKIYPSLMTIGSLTIGENKNPILFIYHLKNFYCHVLHDMT